jgi:hypothetical protein
MLLYIDPGTGSMITQAIIAGVLGFIMFFKQLKFKIINLFKRQNKNEIESNE